MTSMLEGLRALRERLATTDFALDLGGADQARRTRVELIDQIDDYLLPRLERIDAPLLVVIGGSTGAGKSTITNSVVGANVSEAGVLRPTTRVPVLVCHPDDEAWFLEGGVLPDLARSTGVRPSSGAGVHVVAAETVPAGLAILDAPDIDSVETANHDLASQLLGAADLWLFVTTAARYADAVPWEYLARARERAIALAVVVNRIPPGHGDEVSGHLAEMLGQQGLADAHLFAIAESDLDDARLGAEVGAVRDWLVGLVADAEARDALVRSTIDGALASIPSRVDRLTDAIEVQVTGAESLQMLSRHEYDKALELIDAELDSGNLLRGEVLDRWREHVGTGEFMDALQRGVGRVRDRIRSVFTGSSLPDAAAQGQLESNLEILIRQAADQAALETVEGWEALPAGRQALADTPRGLDRATPELGRRVTTEVNEWQQAVLNLVRDQAGDRVALARTLSLGINGIGVAVMCAVFSQTGGLTGGEAAVAGGTAAVSQTVLTAVFGDEAVRGLARRAREDLQLRLVGIFEEERARFDALLERVPSRDDADALTLAADAVEAARG